jgi:hypothetical protein
MMNGHRPSVSASVRGMTTWLKSPASLRLTGVTVNSENRKERFSSARG